MAKDSGVISSDDIVSPIGVYADCGSKGDKPLEGEAIVTFTVFVRPNGGTTELSNLILLCHRHHWLVHEGGWQLVKTEEGRLISIAPTMTFARAREPD